MPNRSVQTRRMGNQRRSLGDNVRQEREYRIARTLTGVVSTTPSDSGRAANFIFLGNVPDVSEFTSLFDLFTIDRVVVTFTCSRAAISAGNSGIFPTLLVALDYNDSTAPTTANDVLSYDGCQVVQFSESKRSHTMSFKPRAQMNAASGTAAFSGPVWCSTGTATAEPWYGYKFWLTDYNSTSTAGSVVTQYVRLEMRFRTPK